MNSAEALLQKLQENYEKVLSCQDREYLFVTQGVLTFDGTNIMMSAITGGSLESESDGPSNQFVAWLATKKPQGLNICLLDFVEKHDFVAKVVQLNF